MRQRLADYVADFLVKKGITDCFMVVGGGAMHLNDALGHKEGLHCTYNHHEQACAMAAEAYARVNNRIAAVCVTTGPGGTNALTGVLGGWLDSIPMLVVSGQVRYDTTARYMQQFTNGLPIRAVGDQEFDITKAAASMCKYAVMLEKPEDIRYILERAYHLATTGRRGPSWVDIPVDFQGLVIETEHLRGYHPAEENAERRTPIEEYTIEEVLERIKHAKRPVFYAGNGIRLSGGYEEFRRFVEQMQLPVPVQPEPQPDAPLKGIRTALRKKRILTAAAAVLAVLCAVVLVFWTGNLSTPVTAEEAGIWLYNKKEDGANLCVLEVQGENVRLETEGGFSWGKEYITVRAMRYTFPGLHAALTKLTGSETVSTEIAVSRTQVLAVECADGTRYYSGGQQVERFIAGENPDGTVRYGYGTEEQYGHDFKKG